MITDIIIAALVVAGGVFCFAAGMGVLRLPDLLTRMHASTKAGTLGSGLILVAVAVAFAETTVIARAVAAILFLLMTAPVAAHLIGRAAFRTGVPMARNTRCEPGVAEALRARPEDDGPR
ncbi:monovalent cation/H(+) antiporter subunit G [Paracoccus sp. ME4]|uniref:monovalent cation/H(+) antiporter subunit G n=1 Tax=Paracoccus sp. ME4 TaxID=3138066 RepID=UPI00398B834B